MAIVNYQQIIDGLKKTDPINTGVPDPNATCIGINCNVATISDLYYNILITFLYVASLAAVITFIYAGITYLTAGGEAEKAEKAKKMITGSVVGIIIIIASFAIIKETIGIVSP